MAIDQIKNKLGLIAYYCPYHGRYVARCMFSTQTEAQRWIDGIVAIVKAEEERARINEKRPTVFDQDGWFTDFRAVAARERLAAIGITGEAEPVTEQELWKVVQAVAGDYRPFRDEVVFQARELLRRKGEK